MKILLSSDIEGVSDLLNFSNAMPGSDNYHFFANNLSEEIAKICSVLPEDTEIYIKDAHMHAQNINHNLLPNNTILISGWSGSPLKMLDSIDSTFNALFLVGYHDAAGSGGNPCAHTFNSKSIHEVKLNGKTISEMDIAILTASSFGVPTIFISGDEEIVTKAQIIFPNIVSVVTKKGVGASVRSKSINQVKKEIESATEKINEILNKTNFDEFLLPLPNKYQIEIEYIHHFDAYRNSFFPGCELITPRKIKFFTNNFFEVLRLFSFVM